MLFVGDIAIPYPKAIQYWKLPQVLQNKKWFGNLEGGIVSNLEEEIKAVVFNSKEAIQSLVEDFDFAGFALANNHIFDAATYEEIASFLNEMKIPFCGIGRNIEEASHPIILKENEKEIIILNFGWEVIQCKVTKGEGVGVNPLTKGDVLRAFNKAKKDYPSAIIISFMHWSYELEAEPQPRERELAKTLIDSGAAGIIGSHPHRIGGFEMYKNRPIVYSLGNWMFKQNYYHHGKLKFQDFCNQELAFEWDLKTDEMKFHFFDYDREESKLTFSHTEGIDSKTMKAHTQFRGFSNEEYMKWYRANHYHKWKGLPIYYWEDTDYKINIKNRVNKLRDSLLYLALRLSMALRLRK